MQREQVPGLAEAIEERRRELDFTPGQLARVAGVTPQGLAPLRRGERRQYQDRLTLAVCKALRWTPDSIDRLLSGGQPIPIDESRAQAFGRRISEYRRANEYDLTQMIDHLVGSAMEDEIDDIPLWIRGQATPRYRSTAEDLEQSGFPGLVAELGWGDPAEYDDFDPGGVSPGNEAAIRRVFEALRAGTAQVSVAAGTAPVAALGDDRLARVEATVARLEASLTRLRADLGKLAKGAHLLGVELGDDDELPDDATHDAPASGEDHR